MLAMIQLVNNSGVGTVRMIPWGSLVATYVLEILGDVYRQ